MTVQTSSFARIGLLAGGRQATGTGVNQKSRIECETLAFDRLGDRIRGGPDSPRSCPQRSEPDLGRVLPPVGLMAGKAIYLLLPVQDWLASFISSLGNGQEKVTARQSTRPFAIAGLIPCEAATFPTSLTRGRNWPIPIFIWELRHFPVLFVQSRPSMGGPFKSPSSCHLSSGSLAVGQWTSCLGCSDLTLVAKREPVLESVPRIFPFFLFIGGTGVWPCADDANSFAMVPNFVEARLRIDYANLGRWTPLACLKVKQNRPIFLSPVNISIHTLLMSRTHDHYELVNQGQNALFQPSTLS